MLGVFHLFRTCLLTYLFNYNLLLHEKSRRRHRNPHQTNDVLLTKLRFKCLFLTFFNFYFVCFFLVFFCFVKFDSCLNWLAWYRSDPNVSCDFSLEKIFSIPVWESEGKYYPTKQLTMAPTSIRILVLSEFDCVTQLQSFPSCLLAAR